MDLNFGPIAIRFYSGDNWTHAEAAWVTNRNGGKARRETAIKAGFKSDHLIDAIGRENPADVFVCPTTGQKYFGKIVSTPSGVYAVSASDVYTAALYKQAVKEGLNAAEEATVKIAPASSNGKSPATPELQAA